MQEKLKRRSNAARTEATRGALLDAARDLFVHKGYADTGTPDIVARANVTRGALYHHFADKTDLFRAVVEREAQAVAKHIEGASANPTSALEALTSGTDAYFEAMAVPGRVRLLLLEGPAVLGRAEIDRIDRQTGGEELREGLAYALDAQEISPAVLGAMTKMLSAGFDRAALAIAEGEPSENYRQATNYLVEAIINKPR
ncbi:MAG: helix-turn-helix domain-containing protein [Pseudomonadota bacterium]